MAGRVSRQRGTCVCEALGLVKECGDLDALIQASRRHSRSLARKLRNELLELVDGAASAHARVDRVAMGAQMVVLDLQIKAAVEIECRAILVKVRPDAGAGGKDEIDLLGAGHERPTDRGDRNALRPLELPPLDLRLLPRLDRNAKDHLILADETGDRLRDDPRLRGEQAEHERHEVEEPRDHLQPTAMKCGFAAKR